MSVADPYECDLPGCVVSSAYEPAEDEDWPPAPPPGWFSVLVARHGLQGVDLMFCSQEHMAEGVGEHLPSASPVVEHESNWTDGLFVALIFVLTIGVWLLGVVTAVVLLVDALS